MIKATRDSLRRAKETEGFTLIELLVVVLILGILSAIVVVAVSNARQNAVVSACNADVVQVAKAAQQYYVDNKGVWPDNSSKTSNTSFVTKYLTSWPDSGEYTITWDKATTTATVTGGPTGCESKKVS